MSGMNALLIGISNLLVGRPDTQVTAKSRLLPEGDHGGDVPLDLDTHLRSLMRNGLLVKCEVGRTRES